MTVRELIEDLKQYPPDLLVLRSDADWGGVKITGTFRAVHHRAYASEDLYWWETDCPEFGEPEEWGEIIE